MARWAICIEAYLEIEAETAEDATEAAEATVDCAGGSFKRGKVISASPGNILQGPQEISGDAYLYYEAHPDRPV